MYRARHEGKVSELPSIEREALTRLLVREGVSVSEWLQEEMRLLLETPNAFPAYDELTSVEELQRPTEVLRGLERMDWSFTDDDTGYLSHDIHPYPAKFIPQIPGHLIARLSLRGELVLDPFGGSGTAALEAVRLGRRAISIDANPIGTLIGQVKTARLDEAALREIKTIRTALETRFSVLPEEPDELIKEFQPFVPYIANREKWFPKSSCGELALIAACIQSADSATAKNIGRLALSRSVLKVSFQDSETRYASKPRDIPRGFTILRFLHDLDLITKKVLNTAPELQYGVVEFVTADTRALDRNRFRDNLVDFVITSPPYGNANDYHLYHRFRLLWLGYDPVKLAKIEIGSHLRHQKEKSGFNEFVAEIQPCISTIFRLLKPGRYAALLIGDSTYEGKRYDGCKSLAVLAENSGFEVLGSIKRIIHRTKRSFIPAGRRAHSESILLLRKPPRRCAIQLSPPSYRMWRYEELLRERELRTLVRSRDGRNTRVTKIVCDPYNIPKIRRLVFSRSIVFEHGHEEKTWQAILENGFANNDAARKDPKYVTHGLHPYKGKFYPQLAKSLINIAGIRDGSKVLDPFCGSGTTLLECRLNGLQAFGCDLHPLAAKIARAKVGILDISPHVVSDVADSIETKLVGSPTVFPKQVDQFSAETVGEIQRWFAAPIVYKLNYILRVIRAVSASVLKDFLEVVLSSIIREVSHQDPRDLRIRRRKNLLPDADVVSLFRQRLRLQMTRLERFWSIRGYSPYRFYKALVGEGDARYITTFQSIGLRPGSVDFVLTSPPYATALPYIDTDRLSLLILCGMTSAQRRPLEEMLTGSREVGNAERHTLETTIERREVALPTDIIDFIHSLYVTNIREEVGFRKRNLPSLLLRFFTDMQRVLLNCKGLLKSSGQAMIVIGDNSTTVNGKATAIPTTKLLLCLSEHVGFDCVEQIPITVTTENLQHIRHAITRNTVLWLRKR
jgi:DNA modification methylase